MLSQPKLNMLPTNSKGFNTSLLRNENKPFIASKLIKLICFSKLYTLWGNLKTFLYVKDNNKVDFFFVFPINDHINSPPAQFHSELLEKEIESWREKSVLVENGTMKKHEEKGDKKLRKPRGRRKGESKIAVNLQSIYCPFDQVIDLLSKVYLKNITYTLTRLV